MIYFIQRITGGPIKIGMSVALSKRFGTLTAQTRATLKILGVMDGDRKEELYLHDRFRAARVAGEWFRPCPELLVFIRDNARDWNGIDEDTHCTDEYLTLSCAGRILKRHPTWVHGTITGMASIGQAERPKQVGRTTAVRRIDVLKIRELGLHKEA